MNSMESHFTWQGPSRSDFAACEAIGRWQVLLWVWRWKAPMRLLVENFEVFETVVFFETVRMVDCMGWGWEEGCKMPCGIEGQLPVEVRGVGK